VDDDLSPRARLLIEVALDEDVPPPATADGSWEMVISRLTMEAASVATPSALPQPATPRRSWVVVVVLALVIAVAGGLLWLVLQPRPKPPTLVPPTTATAPIRTPAAKPAAIESRPAPQTAPDRALAAQLLDEAESAEPTRALELLARHAEIAPMGADTDRRLALRIAALCQLGRTEDARAEARAFLADPRDPKWTKHVQASCAGRSPAP